MEKRECISHSVQQTEEFAKQLAQSFTGGEVVLLMGEMGAGKTHFTKGLASGLDIDETVTSPTFALHNSYVGRLTLNHFDFYRIEDSEEVAILGLDEFFYDKRGVAVIEWSQNIQDLLPKHCIVISIDKLGDNSRKITVTNV